MTTRFGSALLLLAAAACGRTDSPATDSAVASAPPPSVAAPSPSATPDVPALSDSAPSTTTASGEVAPAQAGGALLDPNTATRAQLVAAGLEGHVADAIVAGRPFSNMVAVNRALTSHVPDSAARKAIYAKVWKPIDLNTASGDEILLIPGVGRRMRHEFEEYRPYRSIDQFRREIGKYVDKDEVARLEKYVTIR